MFCARLEGHKGLTGNIDLKGAKSDVPFSLRLRKHPPHDKQESDPHHQEKLISLVVTKKSKLVPACEDEDLSQTLRSHASH